MKNHYTTQVDTTHYINDTYLDIERWLSYFYQIKGVQRVVKIINKKSIQLLEIGVGDKSVSTQLKKNGHQVTTMDFDEALKPDIVSALPEINVSKKINFDCIVCCEVLEHIKYEDVGKSLKNMSKITKYAVVSVPHKNWNLSIKIRFGFLKTFKTMIPIPSPLSFFKFKFDGQHYWELGTKEVSVEKFKKTISGNGFTIIDNYQILEFPYHHFFILVRN